MPESSATTSFDIRENTRRAFLAVNFLTISGGVMLMILSLWPGYAQSCAALLALPLIALLGIFWLIMVVRGARLGIDKCLQRATFSPIVVLMVLGLLYLYVPRRIAFFIFAGQFDGVVNDMRSKGESSRKNIGYIGIWQVDEIRVGRNGGFFFQTGEQPVLLGIDTDHFGFAYQPEAEGSPFGRAYYMIRPLKGDWYWFGANDDW